MRRRPPRLLVVASAVLLAGVVALWVRSYWRADSMQFWGTSATVGLKSNRGALVLLHDRGVPQGAWDWHSGPAHRWVDYPVAQCLGFAYWRYDNTCRLVEVPFWFVAVFAGLPLAWALVTGRSHGEGHCRRCGYDLTANASGRCPECGAIVAAASAEMGP